MASPKVQVATAAIGGALIGAVQWLIDNPDVVSAMPRKVAGAVVVGLWVAQALLPSLRKPKGEGATELRGSVEGEDKQSASGAPSPAPTPEGAKVNEIMQGDTDEELGIGA